MATKYATWFYTNILQKALESKQAKGISQLTIVADGNLGHVPFELFLRERPEECVVAYKDLAYLMNDYTINYSYSARLWLQNNQRKIYENNSQLLAFAASYPVLDSSVMKVRLPVDYVRRKGLSKLDAAEGEVGMLSDLYQGAFFNGLSANEANFKKVASDYGIVHLAMHGLMNPQIPMLSSLVFTENMDSVENNFLQAYEISRMDLKADMIVLSACETGYGKFTQGEGVMSLARSFMYAGTPSLIVSLWQVNDLSTSVIMRFFYENIASGLPKDEELRQAKIKYLQNTQGIAAHPAFWSPFIQLGNNTPVQLQKKTNWWLWGSMVVLVGMLGTGLFLCRKRA